MERLVYTQEGSRKGWSIDRREDGEGGLQTEAEVLKREWKGGRKE